MTTKLNPYDFLKLADRLPVMDVRSPKEFAQGHIPGAINIPLFNDEERATVGITYARSGNQDAILKGLEIVGPKLQGFVRTAKEAAPGGEILVHCWRGGMRSEAMAWLFNFSGIKTNILEGGYKAFRRHIREAFEKGPDLLLLGGMTGSGKTEILRLLREQGEQVIDLEELAHHKGSAFGALGEPVQPTTEQFENDLALQWLALDPGKPVWVEDESLNIGKVVIPEVFFKRMGSSRLFLLELSFERRVSRLIGEYGTFDTKILSALVEKISKRMGGKQAKKATDSLMNHDLKKAVEIVLPYYDETYTYSLKTRENLDITAIDGGGFEDHRALASHLKTIR